MDKIPATTEERIRAMQAWHQEFQQIQIALRKLEREVVIISPYAAQSAAMVNMRRWMDKADKVLQGFKELKL